MAEMKYIISDAAKMINVEPHVLRYWEEELAIEIPRNELGHRYYTDREIHLFENIRDLKDKGFQLKAIKLILSTLNEDIQFVQMDEEASDSAEAEIVEGLDQTCEVSGMNPDPDSMDKAVAEVAPMEPVLVTPEDKMKHFKYIMDAIVTESLQKNNILLENMLRELEHKREEELERYYRMLDEAIRGRQRAMQEVAAAKVPSYGARRPVKPKRGIFRRRYNEW